MSKLTEELDTILNSMRHLEKQQEDAEKPVEKSAEPTFETLHETEWLSLRKKGNYVYAHESRSNGKLVVVLVHDSKNPGHYFGRFEECPAHEGCGRSLYSITGGVENEDVPGTAIHELWEEAGYKANLDEMLFIGDVYPYKAADTVASIYAYDAMGRQPDPNPPGDGSADEAKAYCEWVTEDDAMKSKDPLLIAAISMLSQMKTIQPTLGPTSISPVGPQRF